MDSKSALGWVSYEITCFVLISSKDGAQFNTRRDLCVLRVLQISRYCTLSVTLIFSSSSLFGISGHDKDYSSRIYNLPVVVEAPINSSTSLFNACTVWCVVQHRLLLLSSALDLSAAPPVLYVSTLQPSFLIVPQLANNRHRTFLFHHPLTRNSSKE